MVIKFYYVVVLVCCCVLAYAIFPVVRDVNGKEEYWDFTCRIRNIC